MLLLPISLINWNFSTVFPVIFLKTLFSLLSSYPPVFPMKNTHSKNKNLFEFSANPFPRWISLSLSLSRWRNNRLFIIRRLKKENFSQHLRLSDAVKQLTLERVRVSNISIFFYHGELLTFRMRVFWKICLYKGCGVLSKHGRLFVFSPLTMFQWIINFFYW